MGTLKFNDCSLRGYTALRPGGHRFESRMQNLFFVLF